MNMGRVMRMLRKDLWLGPRKTFFLFAVTMPVVLTLIFQVAFGTLFAPSLRLGIVDYGESALTSGFLETAGIQVTMLNEAEELKNKVEQNDLDAGLILDAGFDAAVNAGERPLLEMYIGGESLAANRIVFIITGVDLVRGLAAAESMLPVEVEIITSGEEGLPIAVRLIPLIMFYALVIAGVFVPGSGLVEEKENSTLTALLVTPVNRSEVLAAKWMLGFILCTVMAAATLFLNQAFGPRPLEVMLVIAVAAALNSAIGLLAGIFSRTSASFFALVKGAGFFLFVPVIFYIFPEWPRWIAMIFPLYWIIEPIWQVSIMGEPLRTVWFELTIATAITAALLLAALLTGRRI